MISGENNNKASIIYNNKSSAAREVTMNLANLLTSIRLLLIPVFVYFFFSDLSYGLELAVAAFLLAGLTDTMDGYIARKLNQITKLGIVLDPLADKLMLVAALVCVTISKNVPVWIIVVVAMKEALMIVGAISLWNDDNAVIPANIIGKLATLLSYIAIISIMFELPFSRQILYAFVATALVALAVYLSSFMSLKKQQFDIMKK